MPTAAKPTLKVRCELDDLTARDLMTPNPVSIRSNATMADSLRFLTDKGVSGAVVIGDAGRPVGVLSSTDVLIHQRERTHEAIAASEATVAEMMTPAVFTVRPDATAKQVAEQMVALNVHRVFVLDETDVVVGVISALDMLRHLA
jgi:CBS domain-containing protein